MKFSGKVWSDHGTTWLHFGSIRVIARCWIADYEKTAGPICTNAPHLLHRSSAMGQYDRPSYTARLLVSSFHELMQSRGVRRPSVNFYTKIATSTTNMTGSPPNLHRMVPTWARIQGVLKVKVKVKGDVIRTLFWLDENRFFYHKHDRIATKLAHDGPQHNPHLRFAKMQSQMSRSNVTWYGHFSDVTKIASSTTNMTG